MVGPALSRTHRVRVLDLHEPDYPVSDTVIASVTDFGALRRACTGVDVVAFLAMGPKDKPNWHEPAVEAAHFEVSVTGLYLCLRAAGEAGVQHAVLTSSMSVFAEHPSTEPGRYHHPDASDAYGLSKRLGEQVCAAVAIDHGMSATALRLSFPMTDAQYLALGGPDKQALSSAESDVVSAFTAAVHVRGTGFSAVQIASDPRERFHDLGPARDVLGWAPTFGPAQP